MPAQNLIPLPDAIGFVAGGGVSAHVRDRVAHAGDARAAASAGEDVLVLAAGSGVGQAAIQIAFMHGARVFATAGSDEKLERARALGADEVDRPLTGRTSPRKSRLTNRRGVDVVIEHVGEATWAKSVRSLARGGRLVTCGATTGRRGATRPARAVRQAAVAARAPTWGRRASCCGRRAFFFAGQLKPVVDRVFPLAEAAAAQQRLEDSGQFGKIVLEVSDG